MNMNIPPGTFASSVNIQVWINENIQVCINENIQVWINEK